MLTPAVRAAAAAYAATQDRPVAGAVEHGYLVGYCAGVRAPRAERFPLPGDAAFKRLLGQYLAENITVFHPATGRYGLLRGLPACYEHDGEPFADVEFYADSEAREGGGGDVLEPYGRILPVLYGFEDLASVFTLGEQLIVPGVAAAEAALLTCGRVLHTRQYSAGWADDKSYFWAELNGGADLICIYADSWAIDINFQNAAPYIAYGKLLEHHFAVGLAPHQYHRRVAGFDYAAGGRPDAQGHKWNCHAEKCGGCDTGKEVRRG